MKRAAKGWQVDASLIFVAFIWGGTFVLVKRALDDVSTLLFLTLRFSVATLALLALFPGKARVDIRRSIKGGFLVGVCLFSGYVFQTLGLQYTTASKAGFLTGLYIPLVPIINALVYKRFPGIAEVLGVTCAFVGMALLTLQGSSFTIAGGDLLVLGCAVAFAFHILLLGHFAQRGDTAVLSVTQIATSAVLGASTFWWAEPVRIRWSREVWLALGVTSLLATAFAFSIQTWAQQYSSPTRTALIFALEPVFAWATSYVTLGEILSSRGIAGGVLILAGILMVELKPTRESIPL